MKGLGRWFVSNLALMFFALVLATFAWIVAAEEDDPTRTDTFPEAIPVEPVGLSDGLVIVGELDEQVVVTVQAPQSVWDELEADDFRATVDLSELDIGEHEVPIEVRVEARPARLECSPDRLTIEVANNIEKTLPIRPVTEGSLAVGYTVVDVDVAPDLAVVAGPSSYVIDVVEIAAIVELGEATANIDGEAQLVALDEDGEPVPYVTITPATVQAMVEVEHSVNYKALAVAAPQRIGEVAPGYRITGVSIDPPAVTVYGSPEAIAALPSFIEASPIDIDGAEEDVIAEAQLQLPAGVTLWGDQIVRITISVEAIQGDLTMDVTVEITGLGPGLIADLFPETVEVFLSGPQPVLDALDESDIRVIVNLTNLARGTHTVQPLVQVPEGTTADSIAPATLQVEISSAPTPTPGGS